MTAAHWSDVYIRAGLRYEGQAFDCSALVERVRSEIFGHALRLPSERSVPAAERGALIAKHLAGYATPTDDPQDGDGVLIVTRGRTQHIGIYCVINGEPWVIHCMEFWNVTRLRLRDLPKWHMKIEGVYRWI